MSPSINDPRINGLKVDRALRARCYLDGGAAFGTGIARGAADPPSLPPSSPKRVPAMRATAANTAFAASNDLRFKQYRVNVWKVLQFQPGNFLSNETLNRLQGGQFFAVHQGESVAHVLSATSSSNAMDVIFRMLGDIVIDHVTDAGDVESSRSDIGRNHDFVFAAFKPFERFDAFALSAIGMQNGNRMVPMFQFVRDAIGAVFCP